MKTSKVTWKDIFQDFKKHHPQYTKQVLGFQPHDYATIVILLPDRVRMTYNYDTKKLTKLSVDEVDHIACKHRHI